MRKALPYLLVFGTLAIFLVTAFLVVRAVQNSTEPMRALSGQVGTQVSGLLSVTPTIIPDPITIVREIRTLSRLETIQYSVEKVITAETGQGPLGFLFGDRLLLVAHGIVIAGVDLGRLGPQDVLIDEQGVLYVQLPEPELFVVTLDNEQTYVYDRESGLLTDGQINLESDARRAAENEIRNAALEDGILSQAERNAQSVLRGLFHSLGYSDIVFVPQGGLPTTENTPRSTAAPSPTP